MRRAGGSPLQVAEVEKAAPTEAKEAAAPSETTAASPRTARREPPLQGFSIAFLLLFRIVWSFHVFFILLRSRRDAVRILAACKGKPFPF